MCLKTNIVVFFSLTKVTHLKSLKSLTTQGVKWKMASPIQQIFTEAILSLQMREQEGRQPSEP